MLTLGHIEATVGDRGLSLRGAFHPTPEDGVPEFDQGGLPGTLVLVGNAGPRMWQAFTDSEPRRTEADPLDTWSVKVVSELALELDAQALFPFGGPPYLPFQRWAVRAETVWPSPIGPLIHGTYGLWHAYRGALSFAERIELPDRTPEQSPCTTCAEQLCLSTCPVNAFTGDGYDVPACIAHIESDEGADCLERGCRARRACPVGQDYQYSRSQAGFHMLAFLRARRS